MTLMHKEMLISLIIALIILLIAVFCTKLYNYQSPGYYYPYRYYHTPSSAYIGIVVAVVFIGIIIFALMLAVLQKINLILYMCAKKLYKYISRKNRNNKNLSNV